MRAKLCMKHQEKLHLNFSFIEAIGDKFVKPRIIPER